MSFHLSLRWKGVQDALEDKYPVLRFAAGRPNINEYTSQGVLFYANYQPTSA